MQWVGGIDVHEEGFEEILNSPILLNPPALSRPFRRARVTYVAPNRAHHFPYALALRNADALHSFVCGASRFNPRNWLDIPRSRFVRADEVQNVFLAAIRLSLPAFACDELAYWSKLWLDFRAGRFTADANLFMYYNGCGMNTARRLLPRGISCVVELVNSHILHQERILREEHEALKLPFRPFHRREVARRITECEEATAVVCASQFAARSIVDQGIPCKRVYTVPYGFPASKPRERRKRERAGFRVLYVGQISVRKGVRYLIEGFRKLRHPRKHLMIVGPIAEPNGLEGLEIPSQVQFTGPLYGEDLEDAYRSADAFVLPSIEEGFGLVMGEALSYGLPVIATENTGAPDLYKHGCEGFIVKIRDSASIAEYLDQLAEDRDVRERFAEAALRRREMVGGWETSGQLLLRTLEKILNNE